MHRPITIAKLRKPITVKVGGANIVLTWVPLVSPDEPYSVHHAARLNLVNKFPDQVNEDFESVEVGRLDNKCSDLNFITPEEKKANEEEAKRTAAQFAKLADDADKRQEAMEKAEADKIAKDHAARIIEINKENDAIRTQAEDRIKQMAKK